MEHDFGYKYSYDHNKKLYVSTIISKKIVICCLASHTQHHDTPPKPTGR